MHGYQSGLRGWAWVGPRYHRNVFHSYPGHHPSQEGKQVHIRDPQNRELGWQRPSLATDAQTSPSCIPKVMQFLLAYPGD